MKSIITALLASFLVATASAASDSAVASGEALKQVTAADDARVAATTKADKEALEKIFSDSLHYAHSSGVIDTKASFIDILTSGKNKYLKMEYVKRDFSFPTNDIALMTGQVAIKTDSVEKGINEFTLTYLGVWKLENGAWRFVAWQSARLAPAAPAPAK